MKNSGIIKTIFLVGMSLVLGTGCQSSAPVSEEILKPDSSLTETYWKAVTLSGEAVLVKEGARETHLVLKQSDSQVKGFSGCNNFFGAYTVEQDSLRFGPLASTRMACPDLEQETLFLQALSKTTRFLIEGESLTFFNEEGAEILRFVAVYLQ